MVDRQVPDTKRSSRPAPPPARSQDYHHHVPDLYHHQQQYQHHQQQFQSLHNIWPELESHQPQIVSRKPHQRHSNSEWWQDFNLWRRFYICLNLSLNHRKCFKHQKQLSCIFSGRMRPKSCIELSDNNQKIYKQQSQRQEDSGNSSMSTSTPKSTRK